MPQPEQLIHWPDPLFELVGFLASFLSSGAIGFRYGVLARLAPPPAGALMADEQRLRADAIHRAALLGTIGILVSAALLGLQLPELAGRRHLTVLQLALGNAMVGSQITLLAMAVVGFVLASVRWNPGWLLAAAGVLIGPIRAALFGQYERLLSPVHELAAGMWIGTLFMLVVVGMSATLRSTIPSARRGVVVADMVSRFSPLALASGAVLILFGLLTAWSHLKTLDALWTTPYGFALIAKLCVVGTVFGFGAFNWLRQRPRLGTEAGARAIRSSATGELLIAMVVLLITAVLVSLPTPGDS